MECEAKAHTTAQLLTLQELTSRAGTTLDNLSNTLADMQLYLLDGEVVQEDVKKLQVENTREISKKSVSLL